MSSFKQIAAALFITTGLIGNAFAADASTAKPADTTKPAATTPAATPAAPAAQADTAKQAGDTTKTPAKTSSKVKQHKKMKKAAAKPTEQKTDSTTPAASSGKIVKPSKTK